MPDDATKLMTEVSIGHVVSIAPSSVVVLVKDQPRSENAEDPSFEMGSMVKMRTGTATVFGIVGSMTVPMPDIDSPATELKMADIELIGEVRKADKKIGSPFRRGVSSYPSLGTDVSTTTGEDLTLVYAAPDKSKVRIGSLHQDSSVAAHAVTDDLLGKHFAVLGTTGTGKSCAVTLILRSILDQHEFGHIVLLDLHNEYAKAFGKRAHVLTPAELELPYWLLTFEEMAEIICGGDAKTKDAMGEILSDLIVEAKRRFADGKNRGFFTADTPVPYRLADLHRLLDLAMGRLDKSNDIAPYIRLKSRLKALKSDPRYEFMFPGLNIRDNMEDIISRLFRIPADGKPLTIVDLSAVPSEILNVVVSVLSRMTFDFALWSDQLAPVLLVCEEAHRYAPSNPGAGFGPTKRAMSKIAKEGRKYGVSLCVVSQRPSELDVTVLSQCSTIFAMRMASQGDHEFVRAAMAESGISLLNFLPSLGTSEAVAVGEGIPVPMRIVFDKLKESERPESGTANFSERWTDGDVPKDALGDIIRRWRRDEKVSVIKPKAASNAN